MIEEHKVQIAVKESTIIFELTFQHFYIAKQFALAAMESPDVKRVNFDIGEREMGDDD